MHREGRTFKQKRQFAAGDGLGPWVGSEGKDRPKTTPVEATAHHVQPAQIPNQSPQLPVVALDKYNTVTRVRVSLETIGLRQQTVKSLSEIHAVLCQQNPADHHW
jgi:hypothetical protein